MPTTNPDCQWFMELLPVKNDLRSAAGTAKLRCQSSRRVVRKGRRWVELSVVDFVVLIPTDDDLPGPVPFTLGIESNITITAVQGRDGFQPAWFAPHDVHQAISPHLSKELAGTYGGEEAPEDSGLPLELTASH